MNNSYLHIPQFPPMPTQDEERRARHTALRRRMLSGNYTEDLEHELLRHFSSDRFLVLGPPDMSSNVFEQITRQLSVLYNLPPTIHHSEDITELTGTDGYVTQAGLFPLMQHVQQFVLGLRETFLRIDVIPHTDQQVFKAGLNYRMVTPDYVYCEASADYPDEPIYYREYRLRMNPQTNEYEYVADVLDIRDPNNALFGMYRVEKDGTLGDDVSEIYMGHPTHRGDDYPYRYSDGKPFLPVELYRAEKTGKLFNPYACSQVVYGALQAACLQTFGFHIFKDCSYPQRYTAGLTIHGLSVQDGDNTARRATVATDPSSILMFNTDPENAGQPLIGQFQAGANPQEVFETISAYEYKIANASGLASSAIKSSGDPRSGYSLSVSRDSQRETARKYAPIFSFFDSRTLAKSAALSNRFLGTNLPESGYRIQYAQLPQSPEEIKAQREDVIQKMGAGLISPIDAMQILHPGIDESTAREMLLKIRRERAELM